MTGPIVTPPKSPARVAALFATFVIGGTVALGLVRAASLPPLVSAVLCFAAVIFASLAISWGAEAAQFYVSQGFAVAGVALLQVMPEFMVEAVIAWSGQLGLMFANATGSNRLLIGLGWPFIYAVAALADRGKGTFTGEIRLRRENVIEVCALAISSSYYLVVLAKGTLAAYDGVVLGALFVLYFWALGRLPAEDEDDADELLAPPRFILSRPSPTVRWTWLAILLVFGAGTLAGVAKPFVLSLQQVALALGISAFAFVQWVAPFLSEFPEKVTAFYWARTVRLAPMALLNMVSSTVSQFTLLVAMIPIVYGLSPHAPTRFASIAMSPDQRVELFLSWAMTLYGVACLLKLRLTRANATVLFVMWLLQFCFAGQLPFSVPLLGGNVHGVIAWILILAAVLEVAAHRDELELKALLAEALALIRQRPLPPG